MGKNSWHVEVWDKDGKTAAAWREVAEFKDVIAIIRDARARGLEETVRISAPLNASKNELETLERLGAVSL